MGRNPASVKSPFQIADIWGLPRGKRTKLRPGAGGEQLFDAFHVGWNVHADGVVVGFYHCDLESVLQPAQLLELLDALEFAGRERWEFQQRIAPKGVQAKGLPVARRRRFTGLADPWNGRA